MMKITLIATAMLAIPSIAHADVVGYWNFDTISDTSDALGGERFFEDANQLHFTRIESTGSVAGTSVVTPVSPANAFTLFMNGTTLSTTTTDLFSIGRTGQLSIQFWYKPTQADTYRYILTQEGNRNAWSMYQTLPDSNGNAAIEFHATSDSGQAHVIRTPAFINTSTDWSHVALTIDSQGTARFYQNGVVVSSQVGFNEFSDHSSELKIGSAANNGGFQNTFYMDDLLIHSSALPPGAGNGVSELAWNVSVSRGLQAATRAPDFGRQWLRSNAFMISSWDTVADPEKLQQFVDANLNSALSGWYIAQQQHGIQQHYLGGHSSLTDDARNQIHIASHLPNLAGWLLKDEIAPAEIDGVAAIADYIRAVDSTGILYAGMGSTGPEYIDSVVSKVKPDALIHAYYPFFGASGTQLDNHFSDFVYFREGALRHNLPFFTYIQSFDDPNTVDDRRIPSESELRFESFTKLTGGAQGIVYFVFDPNRGIPANKNAFIDRDGNQTPLYAAAQQMNKEIANIGQSLRAIDTIVWRYVPGITDGQANHVPLDMIGFAPDSAIDPHVISVSVDIADDNNTGNMKDGVIGWFKDDHGNLYFMLTNVYHGTGLSAAETSLDFIIEFDSSVSELLRLNRLTGLQEIIPLVDHKLYLTLPGGTGDLFKYNTGNFAGLSPIPEPSVISIGFLATALAGSRRIRKTEVQA